MKVEGERTLDAPREVVWAVLNDPAQLAGLIPASGPNRYPRITSITPGSLPSSPATAPFCASVASGFQVISTTWRNIAVPSVVAGSVSPRPAS